MARKIALEPEPSQVMVRVALFTGVRALDLEIVETATSSCEVDRERVPICLRVVTMVGGVGVLVGVRVGVAVRVAVGVGVEVAVGVLSGVAVNVGTSVAV